MTWARHTRSVLVAATLLFVVIFTSSVSISVYADAAEPADPDSLCGSLQTQGGVKPVFCDEYNARADPGADPVTSNESLLTGKNSLLYKAIQIAAMVAGFGSVVMIVVGGFRYMTSGGDSNATKGAKDTIMYAVIGLVVAIFAQVIIVFVLSKL